tara:strand:+ start:148 stop:294 length:147 start_codon:yes stop_codon:yes gene_type:complete
MKAFPLRIKNDKNYDEVVELSSKENRSVNGQLNELLNEALESRKSSKK